MNTNTKSHKRAYLIIALVLASLLTIGSIALALGTTLAAPNDINVTLRCESGISDNYTVEVGQTLTFTVGRINQARIGDPSLASIAYTTTGANNFHVTGLEAGVATIAYGTSIGAVSAALYQITDSNNISAYTIKDGGIVMLSGSGKEKSTPVIVTAGQNNIKWHSSNIAVASVNEDTGLITSVSNGMAIIIGEFTDKWGVARDIHILVGVGMTVGGSSLEELINLINQGETVLGTDPNPYTPESLDDLQDAVDNGKDVLKMDDPSEEDIQKAIDDLKDALSNLEKLPTLPPGVIEGPDGNYYRPVGQPPHVFEKVNKDGSSKQPPEYVYNSGDTPGDGKDIDVAKEEGFYYVESPENIWTPVDTNGEFDDEHAIWGGPNGRPGGGDDMPVSLIDGDYWVQMGQNVFRKYSSSNPRGPLGPLTGGGPDRNPATSGVTEIFDNTSVDGKYYVGPLGPDEDGNNYYYGDPKTGGDGFLDSTKDGPEGDDVKYYKNSDGTMTTTRPPKPIVDKPTVAEDGRVLTPAQTGDTANWIEIARNGDYSLIVRADFIDIIGSNSGDTVFQSSPFGTSSTYQGSSVQTHINDWFNNRALGDNLDGDAKLRNFTVSNNALLMLGNVGSANGGLTDGFSKPSGQVQSLGNDIAFALSFTEAANFISHQYAITGAGSYESSTAAAIANFNRLEPYSPAANLWLRSPGSTPGTAAAIQHSTGNAYQYLTNNAALIYPALWVNSEIFNG